MHLLRDLILPIWLIFWVYWFISASTSKRNSSYAIGRFIWVRIVLFILIVFILAGAKNSDTNPLSRLSPQTYDTLVIIGFIIFILGLALAIWARLYLGKNWGMPMTQKVKPELVTTGPYSFIRHPIYTGILTAMIGTAIAAGFMWVYPFFFFAIYFIYSATVEEKNMLKTFPKTYPAYKKRTKMLIPFVY